MIAQSSGGVILRVLEDMAKYSACVFRRIVAFTSASFDKVSPFQQCFAKLWSMWDCGYYVDWNHSVKCYKNVAGGRDTCICRCLHVAVHHGHAVERLWSLAPVLLSWRCCRRYAVEDNRPRGAFTRTGKSKETGKISFEWSHTRVLSTDIEVRTTLYNIIKK